MGIQYDDLAHGPNDFKDGIEFFEDVKEWSDAYEKSYMVPVRHSVARTVLCVHLTDFPSQLQNKYNHQLAEETSKILLVNVPDVLHPIAKQGVITMLEDRLRIAMM
jgi:hypothetical protein